MAKRKKLTVIAKSAYTGETLEELRERIGDEEYSERLQACHDRGMAAVGLYRPEVIAELEKNGTITF